MARAFKKSLVAVLMATPLLALAAAQDSSGPQTFPSADEGAKALISAVRSGDLGQLSTLFGGGHEALLSSGDDVEDRRHRSDFVAMAEKKLTVQTEGADKAVVQVGENAWPFPIPLVKKGGGWQFDADQGQQEIINRRIGRNELSTLDVMRGYVEAQFDYANADRDGDGVAEYAQKLRSEPGAHDGLYWDAEPGQPESPLGPLVAEAKAGGYQLGNRTETPVPYHGYYYRILSQQGASAPGGKYDYVINGNMIAGFGLVAFPAQYGSSGIMTFLVNHQGKIVQKDLGAQTSQLASAMKEYNPDASWSVVEAR